MLARPCIHACNATVRAHEHTPTTLHTAAAIVVDELPSKVVVDSLAGLEAELQVGKPLLVLLPSDVNASLLAGVELSIADPAVVLQSWGAQHVPRMLEKYVSIPDISLIGKCGHWMI